MDRYWSYCSAVGRRSTCYKKVNLSDPYHLEVIQGEDSIGYGYQIYKGERVIIAQPFYSGCHRERRLSGQNRMPGMRDLVLERIRNRTGFLPCRKKI